MSRLGLGLMLVFLSLATLVQVNDPDPYLWMTIYGIPCVLTLAGFIDTRIIGSLCWWFTCVSVFSALLAYLVIQTSISIAADKFSYWNMLSTEEGRETIGLGIVIVWLFILSYSGQDSRSQTWWHYIGVLLFASATLITWVSYKQFIQPNIDLPEHCSTLL